MSPSTWSWRFVQSISSTHEGNFVDKLLLARVLYAIADDDTTALLDRDETMVDKEYPDSLCALEGVAQREV